MTESPFPINKIKMLQIAGRKEISMDSYHPISIEEREAFCKRPHEYTNVFIGPGSTNELSRLSKDMEIRELISTNSQFAIPPFDKMFILTMDKEIEENIRNGGVMTSYIITRDKLGTYFTVSPFLVDIDREYSENSPNGFYQNYSYRIHTDRPWTNGDLTVFGKRFSDAADAEKTTEIIFPLANRSSFALQLLFLLIYKRPNYMYTVPASHKMVGNKRVAYAAHKTIDLKLFEPKEVISRIAPPTGSHASPRRHDVIGHWMHWNVDIHCDHEWERVVLEEDDPRRRFRENGSEIIRHVCKHCGGRRTFRDHFVRGDATKGCFTHDYVA